MATNLAKPHECIRAARERCGLSQTDAAALLGIGNPQLCMIESGERCHSLRASLLAKMAHAYGQTLDQVYTGYGIPNHFPFTISCGRCDDGAHITSGEQARAEGWADITCVPENAGENWVGYCAECQRQDEAETDAEAAQIGS